MTLGPRVGLTVGDLQQFGVVFRAGILAPVHRKVRFVPDFTGADAAFEVLDRFIHEPAVFLTVFLRIRRLFRVPCGVVTKNGHNVQAAPDVFIDHPVVIPPDEPSLFRLDPVPPEVAPVPRSPHLLQSIQAADARVPVKLVGIGAEVRPAGAVDAERGGSGLRDGWRGANEEDKYGAEEFRGHIGFPEQAETKIRSCRYLSARRRFDAWLRQTRGRHQAIRCSTPGSDQPSPFGRRKFPAPPTAGDPDDARRR